MEYLSGVHLLTLPPPVAIVIDDFDMLFPRGDGEAVGDMVRALALATSTNIVGGNGVHDQRLPPANGPAGGLFMERLRRHRPSLPTLRDYEVSIVIACVVCSEVASHRRG